MSKLSRIGALIAAVIIPFFLVTSAVRIAFNPAFLKYEYSLPDFPADA
jgi:hypothetical protein